MKDGLMYSENNSSNNNNQLGSNKAIHSSVEPYVLSSIAVNLKDRWFSIDDVCSIFGELYREDLRVLLVKFSPEFFSYMLKDGRENFRTNFVMLP